VQGRKEEAGTVPRVAAHAIETIVLDAVAAVMPLTSGQARTSDRQRIRDVVTKVIIGCDAIEIRLDEAAAALSPSNPLIVPWSAPHLRRRRGMVGPANDTEFANRPIRADARAKLLHGIAKAKHWVEAIFTGTAADIETIAEREAITPRSARMILSLAFVAPDIIEAANNGTLPRGFGLSRLTDLPMSWAAQRKRLGLEQPRS
jgi:site-specific DNA recombinase